MLSLHVTRTGSHALMSHAHVRISACHTHTCPCPWRRAPSPTLSPTDPVPRGLLILCPGATSDPQGLYIYSLYAAYMQPISQGGGGGRDREKERALMRRRMCGGSTSSGLCTGTWTIRTDYTGALLICTCTIYTCVYICYI